MALTRLPKIIQRLYGSFFWQKKSEDTVFITFDDGPHPTITPMALALLKKYNAHATFFCVGNNVVKYPEVYHQIIDEGYSIGNHTMSHINGWNTSIKNYIKDVMLAAYNINSNLFRHPYGRIKRKQANFLIKKGYKIVMWSLLTKDYDTLLSPEQCWHNIAHHIKTGDIIVFHD